jgi:IS5 family transposase
LSIKSKLIKSRQFRLPGKKALWQASSSEELVVMDVMESKIERPKNRQKQFYSGKQKEHTLKTQLVIQQRSGLIMCLVNGKGKTHDFKLFKNSGVKFGTSRKVIADKGYQGIGKIHQLSETPIKKKKGKKLSKEEKRYNRQLNRLRITVEHINRRLKIFKILSYPYRNRGKRFGLRANLIAGLHNYDLAN